MAFRDKHKADVEKILDVDAAMSGNLTFRDPVNLRVNGKFEGVLETKGNLIIGETATVLAHIIGDNIVVGGKLKGEVLAKQKLTILSSAVIEGKVQTARLIVNEGGVIEGNIHMLGDYLNVEDLAKYLEVDLVSVTEWASSGKIPAIKEADTWKFQRKVIDEWVASGKVK